MLLLPIYNASLVEQISTATFHPCFLPEECDKILVDWLHKDPKTAKIDGDVVDKRRSTIIHPIPFNEGSRWIWERVADRAQRANQFGFDFDCSGIYNDLQLLEYEEGGHYDWHMDIGPGQNALRKLSVIVQLSDPTDYEGGEVLFKASEKEHVLPRDRGQIAIFPSYVLHKVNPITSGKRYSLVTWLTGHRRFR
jgi:PKHD-type hydroxylase